MNIQTIPRDDKAVKRAFIPKLDALLFADYPNIELKMLAFYLDSIGHPSMAQYFQQDANADLHVATAALINNKPLTGVTDAERQIAKTLNFSIVYGGGIPTLIRQGVAKDAKEALGLLRAFHAAWPGIGWASASRTANPGTLSWFIQERLENRSYITTLWGRHLHPRSVHSSLNALCQGCAADLMKWALLQVHNWTTEEGLESHLVNTVHDELQMDVLKAELSVIAAKVPELMTYKPLQAVVPIKPEPDIAWTNWAEKEEYAPE